MKREISEGQNLIIDQLFKDWLEASKTLERKALDYERARHDRENKRARFIKEYAEARELSPGDIEALLLSL